jgi:parvulin-like peptidyl-prolyl isomerase
VGGAVMIRASRRNSALIGAALVLLAVPAMSATATKSASTKPAATKSSASKSATSAPRDTSRVLARVGKENITRAMVQARIDELPEQYHAQFATPAGRQQLIDRMIEEKVWLNTAIKNGVGDRPKVREQIEQQRRDLLIRTWISEQMANNPAPSDSDARVYYDSHQADYKTPATATVRHIQSANEADSKRLLAFVRDPKQDFAKLAEKYSTDSSSSKNGGQLGTITKEGVFPTLGAQPALAESIFTLAEGKIGGPWKTARGWHLVKLDQKHAESVRPFEQTRALILRQLGAQRTQEYYKTLLESAKRNIGVTTDSAAIKDFVSARKSARDLFKEAQAATDAPARIDGYQRVLAEWPDSDVAPQSQFMIGFIQSEEMKTYDEAERSFRALIQRYPKSELVTSAKWMIDHMRTEEAPAFVTDNADSAGGGHHAAPSHGKSKASGSTSKP